MYTEINTKYRLYISYWLLFMFFLVAIMIVVGGLTRLTDSGLSITEWEFFKGFFPPMNNDSWLAYFESYKQIPEFKLQNFSMTLSEFKVIFWWEWAHRLFGRIIGLAFLIPLIFFKINDILFLSTISCLWVLSLRTSLTISVLIFINLISLLSSRSSFLLRIFNFFLLSGDI